MRNWESFLLFLYTREKEAKDQILNSINFNLISNRVENTQSSSRTHSLSLSLSFKRALDQTAGRWTTTQKGLNKLEPLVGSNFPIIVYDSSLFFVEGFRPFKVGRPLREEREREEGEEERLLSERAPKTTYARLALRALSRRTIVPCPFWSILVRREMTPLLLEEKGKKRTSKTQ